ncbi:tyrosine-type recombinase/integrase [Peredibacter starrii]|uniref:Tyrosine-type recombinase/integrase n=1 Tax=Peredibacter starrii TaxID=28202 RepID=A0AAX4HRA7_9BACT|nr:tyrosine-type recombinase/integrase [Peredibacter starrii]WPU65890.1 tyrosine-type recombinase/integrase [Peredibacter starrii]
MAIQQNKKTGKWKVEVWYKGKRHLTKSFPLKAQAIKFERDTLTQIETQALTGSQAKDYLYDEIFEFWHVNASTRKRESSLVKDVQMHKQYIAPILSGLRISEINSMHFEKIVTGKIKKGLSKSTVNKVIQHFKAVFNHSFNNDYIARNPSRSFKQLKLDNKEMDFLEHDELDQILTYTNQRFVGEERWIHVFYLTLFLTGMRLGEVLGLEWHKIYFDRDRILVSDSWCSKEHKLLGTTKGKKDRTVPLPSLLKVELAALKNSANGSFIFSNVTGRPIDANNFRSRTWAMTFEACEVRRIRIHDARHTYASLFMMNGGNLYDLKKVLGHVDIKTTEKYAHLSNEYLQEVRDIIQPNIGKRADVLSVNSFSRNLDVTYPPLMSERGKDYAVASV